MKNDISDGKDEINNNLKVLINKLNGQFIDTVLKKRLLFRALNKEIKQRNKLIG